MSARGLKQVAVRMHHDPSFVAAVYADPAAALEGEDLTAVERGMLVRPDRRAWAVDPARRDRVLEALRLEFPTACAVAELAAGRAGLLRFFGSAAFHDAVRGHRLLAASFGAWLAEEGASGRLGAGRLHCLATIESACVPLRRGPPPGEVPRELPDRLRLAPWAAPLRLPSGGLELFSALSSALAGASVVRLGGLPRVDGRSLCCILVERKPGPGAELVVGSLPEALASLLLGCREVRDLASLVEELGAEGLDGAEAGDLLLSLLGDGLLVSVD